MSGRSLSWIDPSHWAQLLDRARVETPQGPPSAEATDDGSPSSPSPSDDPAPAGPDPVRLDALLEQVRTQPGVEGAFVCDPLGTPLAASRVEPLELSLAPAFMGLFAHQRRSCGGPERGMLMLGFGGRRRLHLMETISPHGRYGLGVVADHTLPDTVLLKLQLELGRLVRGQ